MKLDIARMLLPRCPHMRLDAMHTDVDVPDFLRAHDLVLRVGEDPRVLGMPDLQLDDWGWSATISIRGARYFVRVPWVAVYAMWLEDELAIGFAYLPPAAVPEPPPAPAPTKPRGHLRQV